MRQFIPFDLGEHLFAIEIFYIREVNRERSVTPVQDAPDFVRGIMNLRGEVVTILDIGLRMGLGAHRPSARMHNIILKTNLELSPTYEREGRDDPLCSEDRVGFLVDSYKDVLLVQEDLIGPTPEDSNEELAAFVAGTIESDRGQFLILDIHALVSPAAAV